MRQKMALDVYKRQDGSSACELLKKSGKFDNVKRLEDISAEIVNKDDVITSCIHKTCLLYTSRCV